jgi:glycosyltransferase involved in cell wall biosynthesis
MRTLVAEYDLGSPQPIWGTDSYDELFLLIRDRERPLTALRVPLSRCKGALGRTDIEELISDGVDLGAWGLGEGPAQLAGGAATPEISVVICTRDRPNSLDRCLAALSRVRYERYEVIVVDNGSTDEATARIASRHGARYVREDRPGLDRARNRGIEDARLGIVAFIDDDVQVDRAWLAGLGGAFADPDVDAVTGLVLPLELETPAQGYFEIYGDGMSKGFRPRVFRASELTTHQCIAVQQVGVGANMAVRKHVLLELGGFDPALGVGTPAAGGDDLDLFHRLLATGRTIRYEPLALAWHQHRRDVESLTIQHYNNGRSFGVYLLKLLQDGAVSRGSVILYATWRWGRLLVGRVVLGLLGRHRLPLPLLWAELRGALHSPFAFVTTFRKNRLEREVSG